MNAGEILDAADQEGKILEKVNQENIKFIRLQFVDILGKVKNMEIPVSRLQESMHKGTAFDGSSIEGYTRIQESDMIAKPDLKTFQILPWTSEEHKTARLICHITHPDGNPFIGDSRHALQRAIDQMKEMYGEDAVFNVGPELEFFLLKKKEDGNIALTDQGGYFDLAPVDHSEDIRTEAAIHLERVGIGFEMGHHEVAPGQQELDIQFGSCLKVADQAITYKYLVRHLAERKGLIATFMAKPFEGINGSGMHTHQSIEAQGRNIFFDGNQADRGYLSDDAMKFIGGILAHAKAIVAVTNPTLNSYKRLVPGYEAPSYITWGRKNRSAMIRVPTLHPGEENATRIEFRAPDPTCNPYLAFTVMLAAGLDGIKNNIWPSEEAGNNIFEMNLDELKQKGIDVLPANLSEAIEALKQDEVLKNALGEHIFNKFIEAKEKEIDEGKLAVTDWERERYVHY